MRNRLAIALVAVTLCLALPKAFFHFELLKSTPVAKATLTFAPSRLILWFSQVPAAGVSTITLLQRGKALEIAKTVIGEKEKTMSVDLAKPLANGSYVIHWKGAGDDGHVQQGDIAFTVAAK